MILYKDRAATVLYEVLKQIPQTKFLLPLNICPIVPDTFLKANKQFEFIDINLENLCMDQNIALQRLKKDSTIDGLLFVKTFGIEFDIEPFYKQVKEFNENIFIIDDMCPCIQSFSIDIKNSYADLALYSSGYSKFVDIGYGGYGFIKDNKFRNIFDGETNTKEFIEYKNEILKQIPLMKQHKKELNNLYKKGIDKKYHLGEKYNNWRFSILVNNKDEILKKIFETDELFASSHYPQIDFSYVQNPLQNTNTNQIHSQIINLFNDFRYDKTKAQQTIDIINRYIK
jgi:dTDP-4-amino-4,6-dideoxygalactose transaminase